MNGTAGLPLGLPVDPSTITVIFTKSQNMKIRVWKNGEGQQ